MESGVFAMEAATYLTAALIDSGEGEFMIETAMLKVFATEVLWRIVNDTIQLFGGKAYFTDEPYERMMRDARINTIGEGANDVLRAFIALVGMRDVGLELKGVVDALFNPIGNLRKITGFAGRKISSLVSSPTVEFAHEELEDDAEQLGRLVGSFGNHVERLLRKYQEDIVDRQYQLERVADSATELYVSACVLKRLEHVLQSTQPGQPLRDRQLTAGRYYLKSVRRRVERNFNRMWDNDDDATTRLANLVLSRD
jgi:hypothetical protein